MTTEMSTKSSAAAGNWIRLTAILAAAAIVTGMVIGEAGDIELFGLSIRATWVGLVLYLLGFFAGLYTKRER